jgi:hypothetical protein
MPVSVRRVAYYHVTVDDRPGVAYALLASMASGGVKLFAFNAIPLGMSKTELVLFPEEEDRLARVAEQQGLTLGGPQHAILVQGDDRLGVLADVHRRLFEAGLNVVSSAGLTDSCGGFGYLIYLRHEEVDRAADVLGA